MYAHVSEVPMEFTRIDNRRRDKRRKEMVTWYRVVDNETADELRPPHWNQAMAEAFADGWNALVTKVETLHDGDCFAAANALGLEA